MRKLQFVWKAFSVLILLGTIWLIVLLVTTTQATHADNNLSFVPKDASMIVYIDGNELVGQSIAEIMFTGQDEALVALIMDHVESRTDEDIQINDIGIDFNSEIVLFQGEFKGMAYHGVLFNLLNAPAFDEYMPLLLDSTQLASSNNEVGLVIGTENGDLKAISKHIFSATSSWFHEKITTLPLEASSAIFFQENDRLNTVHFTFIDNGIQLGGDYGCTSNGTSYPTLQSEGLHLSTALIPTYINDSIIAELALNQADLLSVSVNYFGTDIVDPLNMEFVPNMDAVLQFKSAVNMKQCVDTIAANSSIVSGDGQCSFNEFSLFYEQIDERTIYIGRHRFDATKISTAKHPFEMNGAFRNITAIEGSGLGVKIFEILPIYTASRNIASNVESFHVELEEPKDGVSKLTGKITFAEGHYPIAEIIRWLLSGKIIQ